MSSGVTCVWYLHRAVRPLLVADKVVGSEHHLTDVTVKTCFMPVLMEKETNFIISEGSKSGNRHVFCFYVSL